MLMNLQMPQSVLSSYYLGLSGRSSHAFARIVCSKDFIDGRCEIKIYSSGASGESFARNSVAACLRIAQRLLKAGVSITPVRWHDDFVGYSDLATNVGMTHEAVRLLATGKRGPGDFPKPRGYIGVAANRSPIWTWAEVSPWFNANYEIKDVEHFPNNDQIIEINARLSALRKKFQPKSLATI